MFLDFGSQVTQLIARRVRESGGIERVQCAVLKLSAGSLEMLKSAIQAAQADWRDTLVAAEFADDARQYLAWLCSAAEPH